MYFLWLYYNTQCPKLQVLGAKFKGIALLNVMNSLFYVPLASICSLNRIFSEQKTRQMCIKNRRII